MEMGRKSSIVVGEHIFWYRFYSVIFCFFFLFGILFLGYYWQDESPVTFLNWNTNAPYKGLRHFCVGMGNNGRWMDLPCESQHQSVCKIDRHKLRCTGGEDTVCCTPETPCSVGEGDCDNNADCGGDLVCGSDNCPWGDADCCTEAYSCMEKDTGYYGNDLLFQSNISSWQTCSEICRAVPRCNAWTWNAPGFFNKTMWGNCSLKTSDNSGRMKRVGLISGSRECGIKKLRCHGDDVGCCTPDKPCGVGEGDCDENEDCAGDLKCGSGNCPWGDGDDCCFRDLRCKGQDSGCCMPETPCLIGDGDCDNNADCAGDLICGSDNCPWSTDDCCTEVHTCMEKDVDYHGYTIQTQWNITSWLSCSELCRAVPRCKAWTWNAPKSFNETLWNTCSLKTSDRGRLNVIGRISGSRECGKKRLRCHGDDSGCCTPDTPCGEGEGDCDANEDCAGNLICGTDNCPWGDNDDCCFRANMQCTFKLGDGIGGTEVKIGKQKGVECAQACYARSVTDDTINGATVYSETNKGGCWCERSMKSRNDEKIYKSCFFTEEWCSFKSGDGTGASEIKIGQQIGMDCVEACRKRSFTDSTINGATVYSDSAKGGCWCEQKMQGRNSNKKYRSCFFSTAGPTSFQICEHATSDVKVLSCPDGRVLSIMEALYGRKSLDVCGHTQHRNIQDCGNATSSLIQAKKICDNKMFCTLKAANSMFGDPCLHVNKYLDVTYECVRNWTLQQTNVCFEAKNDKFGTFTMKKSGIVDAIKLIHQSGYVSCTGGLKSSKNNSNWGCNNGDQLRIIITDDLNKVLFPSSVSIDSKGIYHLHPYTSQSKEIVITNHFEKIKVNKNQVLRLWYGEDLKGFTEFDNHGRSCADVFAYVKGAKHDCQIKVLSNDYQVDGRNGRDVGKYFHFNRNSIHGLQKSKVLTFVASNSRTGDIGRVKVWGSSKGGSVGNAHGRFDSYPIFAKAGQWATGDFIIPRDGSFCADECPASHPYVYFGGDYCCMSSKEKIYTPQGAACDGGKISIDSKCCANDAHIRCPHGGNCVNHRKTGASIPDINFALNKPSTQSTTYGNLGRNSADKANDGNMISRSATWGKPGDEWWEVDLENLIKIDRIVLYLYPYALRTNKYQKWMVSTRSSLNENWVLCKNIGKTSSRSVLITCNRETIARYVKVTLQNDDTFYLTEVEVYGTLVEIKTNQTGKEWCTFEKNLCGYNLSGMWRHNKYRTMTYSTGPKSGVDGSKWYVYAEASGKDPGYVSTLVSPIFPGRNGSQCYSWFYHMFGKGVGMLTVYLIGSNSTRIISERQGNHGETWYKEHYEITSNVSFQIKFVAIRGSSYQADIALDNLFLLPGSCDVNVALNKPANLSHGDFNDAQLGNDGSIYTEALISDISILTSNRKPISWWEVDLQTSIRILKIRLYAYIRLLYLYEYNKVRLTVSTRRTNSGNWTICKTIKPLKKKFHEVQCELSTVARYIRVSFQMRNRTGPAFFRCAEVEVYAVHNTSCSLSEYTCEANRRQSGGWKTIHNITIDNCAELCCKNVECIGFTHTPKTRLCSLSKDSRNQRPLLKSNDGTSQCQLAEETARAKSSGKPFVMSYTDCWFKCGMKGGRCSFCGEKGYCCHRNYDKDCPRRLSSIAGDHYVCVHDPSADETIQPNISSTCDEGWTIFNDHCYYFSLGVANYFEAVQKCRNNGSHLTSILSADENAFLMRPSKAGYSKYRRVYIGMNDMTNEGVWHWDDGSLLKYVNFKSNEPNDAYGGEDCVEIYDASGKWNDVPCNRKKTYICKKHLNGTDVILIPTEAPVNGWCELGWHLYGSKCYKFFFDERKSFKDALEHCRRYSDGNLVSIHSSLEHAFLLSHMHSTFGSVYIGLHEGDKILYWSDQSVLDYTNWGDNKYLDSRDVRAAVMIPDNDGKWTVSDRSRHFNFICQRAASTTIQNSEVPGTTSSSSICPESYTLYNGDCYKAISTPKSWYEAKKECKKVPGKKGNLVSYHDIFTQAFVFSSLTKYYRSWIGLTRQKGDDNFVWSDNTPLDFNFWKDGQIPVNNDSGLCISEAHSSTFRGTWEGNNCTLRLPFTCKITLREVSVTSNYIGNCTAGWQKFGKTCYKLFYSSTRTRRSFRPFGRFVPWHRGFFRPSLRRYHSRRTKQNQMKYTWSRARKECQRYGGELATIDSKEINQFIEKLVESSTQQSKFQIWIGLNDRDKEHIWRWSSGAPYYVNGFTNWQDGEPNDPSVYLDEDCAAILSHNYKWIDEDCTKQKHWICEHPVECRVALGMENRNIPDNSITASSHADNYYPKYARLNAKIGDEHTAWCANASDLEPSLTINLGDEMVVTLIQLQGLTRNHVTQYKLNYSMDGETWLTYSEDNGYGMQPRVLPGNDISDKNDKMVGAQIELKAIFLKFLPIKYSDLACMRLELFGCKSVCGRALGMASHLIPNDRLSASSSDIDHPVEHARPKFAASGWCSAARDILPWYQIDLGQPMKVSRIMLSGSGFRDYMVLFDGKKSRWEPYTGYDGNIRIFPINPNLHDLEYPQLSRNVQIRPNTAFETVSYCLQVELYGCEYECDESLGSESNLVTDAQFTASSQDPSHPISFARLNQGTFNKNSWCAAVKDLDQYLQIDFTNRVRITHVAVQGFDGDVPRFVKTYNLFWSRSGHFFHHLEEELIGNRNGIDVNKIKLSQPVLARSIRLNPTSFSGGICMRVELYGCSLDPMDAKHRKQEPSPSAGLSRGGKIAIISFFCICLLILLLVGALYYRKRRGDLLFRAFLPAVIELKDEVNLVDDNDDNDYEEDGDCQYEEDGNLIK